MAELSNGGVTLDIRVPDTAAFDAVTAELIADKVLSRIAAHDATLWGPDAESEASIRLSWVDLAASSRPLVAEITALRAELVAAGIDHVVLAGMGGSSLAPEVICATAGVPLVTLDTTDAGQVADAIATELDRTVLVVSSKSGGTVETDSHRRAYEKAFTDAGIDAKSRIVVVTDPGSPLNKLADEAGYRKVFLADPHVGGRYSALTAFGLVPSGLAGADIGALLDEAAAAAEVLTGDSTANPGLLLGAVLGSGHNAGSDKVVFADLGSGITGFGDWVEQLIAESTGKNSKGLLPVVVESGEVTGFSKAGTDAILIQLGGGEVTHPPASGFGASVSGTLGAQLMLWEYATAVAGRIIGINPFDQPNVEEAKKQARTLLDAPAASAASTPALTDSGIEIYPTGFELDAATDLAGALAAFFASAPELGYVSVQAYIDRLTDASAFNLRDAVSVRTGLQTTFGWGPRFLHSTGQYHKGGHQNGIFLQITGAVTQDLAIPDQPFSFAVLQAAQAAGDAKVLADKGRPVLHLHLTDRAAGIGKLLEIL
jgi:glucose-6-phosphate isomerase